MSPKEKLEVTPTKAGVIVRLICYPLFLFPLVAFIVYIGIKEAKADPGKWMILWLLFLIVFAVFFVRDFCESIIGYFHRCLVLTEAECYYINSFGKKKKFQLNEVRYSVRHYRNGARLILRDGNGKLIASLVCDYSLKNVEKIRSFIDSHRK